MQFLLVNKTHDHFCGITLRVKGTIDKFRSYLCSVIAPESAHLSRSSTPHSISSGGLESRSPVLSSGSGVFENETQRKKSQPHSDKGYGSTTSVSSGSSGDSK